MTPTTKAGKECPSRMCLNGRDAMKESLPCQTCHGLGWLPAPGDALTKEEAMTLAHLHAFHVQFHRAGEWLDVDCQGDLNDHEAFRLSPAQEEPAAMESVEEASVRCWDDETNLVPYPTYLKGFKASTAWLLSLTPAQLEALRKERA